MYGITENNLEQFNAFQVTQGGTSVDNVYDIDAAAARTFFAHSMAHPSAPLVLEPETAQLASLNPGAKVAIYVSGGPGNKETPLVVTLNRIDHAKFTYTCEGSLESKNMVPDSPMVSWDFTQLPEDLWPDECVRSKYDTNDTCNGAHIIAIYDYGTPRLGYRNALFARVDHAMRQHKRMQPYYKDGSQRKPWDNTPYEGHHAVNRKDGKWSGRTARGTYHGDLFELATAVLTRKPMLDIPYGIDKNRFWTHYVKAGKPGWIGEFRDPHRDINPTQLIYMPKRRPDFTVRTNGCVNIKTFSRWVVANYKRLQRPIGELIAQRKEQCWEAEKAEWDSYVRDMEFDSGFTSRDADKEYADTEYGMPLDKFFKVIEAVGFERVLEDGYTHSHCGRERSDTYYVYAHRDGWVLTFETYTADHGEEEGFGEVSLNTTDLYYNWQPESRDFPGRLVSSGGYIRTENDQDTPTIWSGNHEVSSGLCQTMNRLASNGTIHNPWKENPIPWLSSHHAVPEQDRSVPAGDAYRAESQRYHDALTARSNDNYRKLPDWVKTMIGSKL